MKGFVFLEKYFSDMVMSRFAGAEHDNENGVIVQNSSSPWPEEATHCRRKFALAGVF
jgi:hypothetical protein